MIVAIDGPVAAGKGTLARRIAEIYQLNYLDTGALYRAVGLLVLRSGGDPANEAAAVSAAGHVGEIDPADPDLRNEDTGLAASAVAGIPAVRQALLDYQRAFAKRPPGAVLDGRDIGTVICPEADVKLFVTASAEARARRRFEEITARGEDALYATVLADLLARDQQDLNRAKAPLAKAEDAHLLDTTKLDIEAALDAARSIVDARIGDQSGRLG